MSNLRLRTYGDLNLKTISIKQLHYDQPEKEKLFKDMIVCMREHNGIGLAAPQVGLNLSLFVWHHDQKDHIAVNPTMIKRYGDCYTTTEGCLSIPGHLFAVPRFTGIHMSYYDIDGEYQEIDTDDPELAKILQHESDHLHGVLICDIASREQKRNFIRSWSQQRKDTIHEKPFR